MPDVRDYLWAGGAGLAAYLVLEHLRSSSSGHWVTTAGTLTGVPTTSFTTASGEFVNYTDTYIAQKAHALVTFDVSAFFAFDVKNIAGQLLDRDHQRVPRATVEFRTQVLAWYAQEITRLCGLELGQVSATIEGRDGPPAIDQSFLSTLGTVLSPVLSGEAMASGSPLNLDSANNVLRAWKAYGAPCRRAARENTDDGQLAYWDLLGRLAIAINVDRATPQYDGQIWSYVIESASNLPENVGAAVRYVVTGAAGILADVVFGLIPMPVLLAAGVAAVVAFRGPIINAVKG